MSEVQAAKARVLSLHRELDAAPAEAAAPVLARHTTGGWLWRGMHPWGTLTGAAAVAEAFAAPLKRAFAPVQRRPDLFFAGRNSLDGGASLWVAAMGHLLGNFDGPFLGIRPTRRMAFLRYAEFHRIEAGLVAETAAFLDLLGLLVQVGSPAVPRGTGTFLLTPGPLTHDGLLYDDRPLEEGAATLALIERMVDRLVGEGVRTTKAELELDWAEDMLWWGPAGIGASFTQARYLEQHCAPFEEGLVFVRHNGHGVHVGEGAFGGFFGYPSLTMKPAGGYMGLTTASDREADMRIVDLYRRAGDRLAENWIFIDHLHFLAMLGLDLLERHRAIAD
jgi:hypothetical protein